MSPEAPAGTTRRTIIYRLAGAVAAAALVMLAIPYIVHVEHPASAANPDSTVADPARVSAGRAVFHGKGTCFMCHGPQLQGGIGPTLKAHAWKDAKGGTLEAIYAVVTHGVPGTAMVSHPGGIDDATAREVATYVWAVSQGIAKP